MKKSLILSILTIIFCFGMNSCSKCQNCTQASEPEIIVCENDYNSNTEYGAALDYYQGLGYNCN